MLAAIFTAGIIVAGAIFDLAQNQIWEEMARKLITLDIYRVIIGGISTIIFIRIGKYNFKIKWIMDMLSLVYTISAVVGGGLFGVA